MDPGAAVVVVLLSAPQQVAIFAPVVEALEDMGLGCRVLTLDWWYGRETAETARAGGQVADVISGNGHRPGPGFYRRSVLRVWRDVLRARRPIDRALLGGDVLVLGNDSGLLEKVAIQSAHNRGIAAALVQDGRLASERAGAETVPGALFSAGKTLASPFLRLMGLGFLAASRYGAGGTELAIANGAHGAAVLRSAARGTRVVVGGQPRYDRLATYPRGGDPQGPVVMFTSPFAADGLGRASQGAQERFAADLASALGDRGIELVVKPHPRETPDDYARHLGDEHISVARPAELLTGARVAVIGISSVTEEAGLLACPVLVPGKVVHGHRFESSLPDPTLYPRFESARSMAEAILALSDPQARSSLLEPQRRRIAEEVFVDPVRPAARIHAELIAALVSAPAAAKDSNPVANGAP